MHCFHYLHPIWRGTAGAQFYGGLDSTDPNTEVTKLTKDLVQIEDALTNSLHERKTRYIFEGVSHLIAAILIGMELVLALFLFILFILIGFLILL